MEVEGIYVRSLNVCLELGEENGRESISTLHV